MGARVLLLLLLLLLCAAGASEDACSWSSDLHPPRHHRLLLW